MYETEPRKAMRLKLIPYRAYLTCMWDLQFDNAAWFTEEAEIGRTSDP